MVGNGRKCTFKKYKVDYSRNLCPGSSTFRRTIVLFSAFNSMALGLHPCHWQKKHIFKAHNQDKPSPPQSSSRMELVRKIRDTAGVN